MKKAYILLCLLLVVIYDEQQIKAQTNEDKTNGGVDGTKEFEGGFIEPPFPNLLSLSKDSDKIHIVTESITPENGYQTTEEFIDLKIHKNAFVTKDKRGQSVTFLDIRNKLYYKYSPYHCTALTFDQLNPYTSELWLTDMEYMNDAGGPEKGYYFGVAAIWINAAKRPKIYSKTQFIFSLSKNLYKAAHKWTVVDVNSKTQAHLYFIETNPESGRKTNDDDQEPKLSLELIQIESTSTNNTIRTINILAVDNEIPEEAYYDILQVPVGYGCHDAETTDQSRFQYMSQMRNFFSIILTENHKIQFEATATKYELVTDPKTLVVSTKSLSDTISVELVHTNKLGQDRLQMVRQRDTSKDVKIVTEFLLNIQYNIDLRKGTCEMLNLGEHSEDENEKVSLKFNANKLELNLDLVKIDLVFLNYAGFFFIKKLDYPDVSLYYFEKSTTDLFPGKLARIIRVYSVPRLSDSDNIDNFNMYSKLETVMIRVLYDTEQNVLESYHLNIIDASKVDSNIELAKLFDVSEECYLNNDKMKSGKDYAWVEVGYSVMNKLIPTLSANIKTIKELVYNLLQHRLISIFNAPKIELLLEDDSMTLRILLLDLPPLPILFEYRRDTILQVDKSLGDVEELTQDLQHCADLCRLNQCQVMSFSQYTFNCLLGLSQENGVGAPKRKLMRNNAFVSYVMPQKEEPIFEDLYKLSLHRMIADLQHKEYDDLMIPKMPEEMSLPISETGVSPEERFKISMEYLNNLAKFIKEEGHKVPLLTFIATLDVTSVAFVPNRFLIEEDPLSKFDLSNKRPTLGGSEEEDLDEIQDQQTTANFHEGISLHHYKISALLESEETKKRSKLFDGLTYDQCALACVDARCSSFSYCGNRQECIITDIWDIGSKVSNKAIEQDMDCFVAQRDFISKFNKFSGVTRPNVYKKSIKALNPSECAHACVIETDFNCLAFDYCQAKPEELIDQPGMIVKDSQQQASCFFRDQRFLYTGNPDASSAEIKPASSKSRDSNKNKENYNMTLPCDHYSRSYLADFNRIEYRKIDDNVITKFTKNVIKGQSVDQCADKCVNEFHQCSAFQFCYNPKSLQNCTLIDGKPEGISTNDTEALINDKGDELVKVGKIFVPDQNCHVFSLRQDSSEAQLRDLALNANSVEEIADRKRREKALNDGSLSLGGAFLLFVSMTVLFAAIGCGFMVAREKSPLVRDYSDRLQTLLRL